MRLHEKAPFGVVSTRMVLDVRIGDGPTAYTIDATATLVDHGVGAATELPDY